MLEYVHIQNLVWNLTMQEPAHYIFLYILLAACRPLSNANIWKWMDIMYIYILFMYDNIISYQWFRYINNINIDNRFYASDRFNTIPLEHNTAVSQLTRSSKYCPFFKLERLQGVRIQWSPIYIITQALRGITHWDPWDCMFPYMNGKFLWYM